MKDYTSINICDCGRPWCKFYDSNKDVSLSENEIKNIIKELEEYDIEKQIKHLRSLLPTND